MAFKSFAPEVVYRTVVRHAVTRKPHEMDVLLKGLLDTTARISVIQIGIEQHLDHHTRVETVVPPPLYCLISCPISSLSTTSFTKRTGWFSGILEKISSGNRLGLWDGNALNCTFIALFGDT